MNHELQKKKKAALLHVENNIPGAPLSVKLRVAEQGVRIAYTLWIPRIGGVEQTYLEYPILN